MANFVPQVAVAVICCGDCLDGSLSHEDVTRRSFRMIMNVLDFYFLFKIYCIIRELPCRKDILYSNIDSYDYYSYLIT